MILGRRKKEWYCNHTLLCPLPQLTIYYHVASEVFPKLGFLLLLYKACIKKFNFFSLFSKAIQDQNHSVLVGISDMLRFPQLQISWPLHSLEVTRWWTLSTISGEIVEGGCLLGCVETENTSHQSRGS